MRISEMQKRKIPVGLGVDGSASNDASNLLEEIRTAFLLHRLTWGDQAPSGYDLLKMATAGGAAVLGRDDIGSIEVGKAADVFAIQKGMDTVCAEDDPMNLFGTVGYHRPCDLVFVNGICTVSDGKILRIDEEKMYRDAAKEVRRFLNG
jgi:cytosine/adenosine deaminase-related metal-dependent hydrolase